MKEALRLTKVREADKASASHIYLQKNSLQFPSSMVK